MEEKMVNETSMNESMKSVEEENLQDVAGGKGFSITKLCTQKRDAALVYHRCLLVKADSPATDAETNRKICVYECTDCKKVFTFRIHYQDEILYRARILEGTAKDPDAGVIRGTW